MFTLFDYLDPERTEARRRDQRADAARDRARKEHARHDSARTAATPFLAERRELLASLAKMWETDTPDQCIDILNGCPHDFPFAHRPRSRRTWLVPRLGVWFGWAQLTVVSLVLIIAVFLITL